MDIMMDLLISTTQDAKKSSTFGEITEMCEIFVQWNLHFLWSSSDDCWKKTFKLHLSANDYLHIKM